MPPPRVLLSGAVCAVVAVSLQGCAMDIPRHRLGNWRAKDNYLQSYQYVPPGATTSQARLNSCSLARNTPASLVCNGHGKCASWYEPSTDVTSVAATATTNQTLPVTLPRRTLSFCECDIEWGDPECRTQRKSQQTAFMLSIFLGPLGVDQFYLGFNWYGFFKLITLGGFGLWYMYDIVRIGSTAVLTSQSFRVANNVSHGAFVLTIIAVTCFFGFLVSFISINNERVRKAREIMLLKLEANLDRNGFQNVDQRRQPITAPFSGYGTTLSQSYA